MGPSAKLGFDSSFFLDLVMLISAYLSDRYQSRGIATALVATLAVVGYSIYFGKRHPTVLKNLAKSKCLLYSCA